MTTTHRFISLLVPACLLLGSVAHGSGTRVNFKDAFAIGRGNAFAATADSPAAIYYNPAGITQLEGQQISSSVYFVSLQSEYTDAATGRKSEMEDPFVPVPQVYYTFSPAESPWSFGLGVYAPFGLKSEWDEDVFRTVATKAREDFLTVAPTVAYQLTPTLSVAGTLTYNKLNLDLRQGIFSPVAGADEFRYTGSDEAVSFNMGILWQPTVKHSFGLTYHHQTSFDTKGRTETRPFIPGKEKASASIDYPEVIIAGYSFRPTPAWNFEFNLDWQNWERRNDVTIKKGSGPAVLPFNWESGFLYEFGATRYFKNGYHLSAGYIYAEDSSPDATYKAAIPDGNRHFASAGVGYKGVAWQCDLSVQQAFMKTRTVRGSPLTGGGDNSDGAYKNEVTAIAVSAGYRF